MEIKNTERAQHVIQRAHEECLKERNEYLTPEHLLMAMILRDSYFYQYLLLYGKAKPLIKSLEKQFEQMPKVEGSEKYEPELSAQFQQVIEQACLQVISSNAEEMDVSHLVAALLQLDDSWAAYFLKATLNGQETQFLSDLIAAYDHQDVLEKK